MATSIMSVADLQRLLDTLSGRGFEIIGPTARDGAIVYRQLRSTEELPIGYQESQASGLYRLRATKDDSLFSYTLGPQSWKRYLLPPKHNLFQAHLEGRVFTVTTEMEEPPLTAFLGVRACEMAALAVLDKVLLDGPYVAAHYRKQRERTLIIAVNCTRAGGTCFCTSMKTGPRVSSGYDILFTEIAEAGQSLCLAQAGSDRGKELLASLQLTEASEARLQAADEAIEEAALSMGRKVNTDSLPDILRHSLTDSHWDEIAARCLSCGNCTMVCPTCFCGTTEDTTDLSGQTARRTLRWDSCHTSDFSYIHGGSVRASVMARYRQWIMHKLAYWPEQFGTFGCVGCGRCITWCPVGIDITEEAATFREKASR